MAERNSMPHPIIGLTTRNGQNSAKLPTVDLMRAYVDAVTGAGGVPVLIPSGLTEEARLSLLDRLDGLLFTGGGDIDPERYGGKPYPRLIEVDPERDALEFALLQAAAETGKPFLGICRGCQVVTAALGGRLYTDIGGQLPGALKHNYDSNTERQVIAHPVQVDLGTRLAGILGERQISVNSLHHQGAQEIPPALRPAAHAPDGLVEAVELAGHPFGIGVQWHPEWLLDQPAARRLFKAFVEACNV